MNNGICSINLPVPFQTDYLSSYIPNNLVRYSQLELSIPQRLLGNSISIPSIYGLPINTNSRLDFENNLIYIVDTSADPVAQAAASVAPYSIRSTLVQVPTTQIATRLIIDWGDGSIETYQSNPQIASHIYSSHGIYYVQISFPSIINNADYYAPLNTPFCNGRDGKIIGILSFGNKIRSFTFQFMPNIFVVPKNIPGQMTSINPTTGSVLGKNISLWDISNITTLNNFSFSGRFNEDVSSWKFNPSITSLANLFLACQRFNNGDPYTESSSATVPIPAFAAGNNLNKWDVSNITNMNGIFGGCWYFNQNLNNWNVSKVTNFTSAFGQGHNTFNSFDGDLTGWTLASSGVNCTSMFGIDIGGTNRGRLFTGKGVDGWNTSGVTNMRNMFGGSTLFNKNLSGWNTSNVTDMSYMFSSCISFTGSGLSGWDTSKVTSLANTFQFASSFNTNINSWNTSMVTNMSSTFQSATSFNQPLNNWNVRKVTTFASMFQGATSFDSSLSGWELGVDASGVNCSSMFFGASSFTGSGLNTWDTSKVTNMGAMFQSSNSFNQNIGSWDTSNVTSMASMFLSNTAFNNGGSPSINNWNTINLTNMPAMFWVARAFNQPIGNWNVSKVTSFANCFNQAVLFDQDISNWNLAGINSAGGLDNFMLNKPYDIGVPLSRTNYDALLIGWNNNKLVGANGVANWRTDLRPHFGGAKYTAGGAAAAARAALVSYGWTITDGGSV